MRALSRLRPETRIRGVLVSLRVRNLAVFEEAELVPGPGLTVLTGETGAGKSLLVDALSLCLGARASSSLVRAGADRASVDAVFAFDPERLGPVLEEAGVEVPEGEELILRRELSREGRSRAWVNGQPVPLATLASVAPLLVDIHGQNEHETLARGPVQRALLDRYAGAEEALARVRGAYALWEETRARLEALSEEVARARAGRELAEYNLAELEALGLSDLDEEALLARRRLLAEAGAIQEAVAAAHQVLYESGESVVAALAGVARTLDRIARLDPRLAALRERILAAEAELEDVAGELAGFLDLDAAGTAELDALEERLALLARLKRKHGADLAGLRALAERLAREVRMAVEGEEELEGLRERLAEAQRALSAAAAVLSGKRVAAARRLEGAVGRELEALGMRGARLGVALEPLPSVGPDGTERVSFLLAANPGEAPQPLSRCASGGELARVMLALKTVLGGCDETPVLVFDEIDANVGGRTGEQLGRRLKALAARHQVLCVTHLPQIACCATAHLYVEKTTTGGRTYARVAPLSPEERVRELARMLGGRRETALRHAAELLRAGAAT